jgi:rare lipoprotein A
VTAARAISAAAAWSIALGVVGVGCGGAGAEAPEAKTASPTEAAGSGVGEVAAAKGGSGERGDASYYSDKLAGRPTASGEPYAPKALTAAHRTLPFGTIVLVEREDGRKVEVRINDRGPFKGGRVIDLSRRAAEELGMIREGVVPVVVRVVKEAPPKPARRKRSRP